MNYQVSARKWRPQTFEEIIGQQHVVTTLKNALKQGVFAQAYLFSGMRGVGKTTMARILAKGLNCSSTNELPCNQCHSCIEITEGRSVDVIEIDGASNTGVDDVRELREMVKYLPLSGRYKVYIIDEVHMLSNAAFNALLKTLEEPPPHLVFILATTASHKIPSTILSRCQHFIFRWIPRQEIVAQLKRVIAERGALFTESAVHLIARVAEGSMRDALSLLDQAISYAGVGREVKEEDLSTLLGRVGASKFHILISAIHQKNAAALLELAKELADQGCDLRQFLADWMEHLRHVIVAQNVQETDAWIEIPKEEVALVKAEASLFSPEEMQRLFSLFVRLQEEIRASPHPHLNFEVALMRAMLLAQLQPVEKVIERLEALARGEAIAPPIPDSKGLSTPEVPLGKKVQEPLLKPFLNSQEGQKEMWKSILLEVKERRPHLGSYLEQGQLLQMNDRSLTIGYTQKTSFLISLLLKEDHKKWLDDLLKARFQQEVNVVIVEIPEQDPPRKKIPATAHPLIQESLSVFGGKIIETKQHDR